TGDLVVVFSVNDPAALPVPDNIFHHGSVKYSVPSGTYWAVGFFTQVFNHGRSANLRIDVLPQFTIKRNAAVHLAARATTSKIAITTPRPAVIRSEGLALSRSAPGAFPTGFSWLL